MKLYLVEHVQKRGQYFEGKMIGICSTKAKAEEVVRKYEILDGFKETIEGFKIRIFILDKNYHEKGFKSWYEKKYEQIKERV